MTVKKCMSVYLAICLTNTPISCRVFPILGLSDRAKCKYLLIINNEWCVASL